MLHLLYSITASKTDSEEECNNSDDLLRGEDKSVNEDCTVTNTEPRIISKMHYVAGAGQNDDHTRALLGEESAGMSEVEIASVTIKLKAERTACLQWGVAEIWTGILNRLRKKGVKSLEGHYITLMCEVNKLLRDTPMEKLEPIRDAIYECSYGYFEVHKHWQVELEKKYMAIHNQTYREGSRYIAAKDGKCRGCIGRIMSVANQSVIKTLNRNIKDWKRQIRKNRTPEQVLEDDKLRKGNGKTHTKRKKGPRKIDNGGTKEMECTIEKKSEDEPSEREW